ncbi:MAG: autotransporter domain-containing protein, partial [Micropepsaceae bacterium]
MIRIRSQKLLSGVSTLAVLASFGAVDPVLAAAYTGPGLIVPITNAGTDTVVTVTGPVVVNLDGLGNSITNTGTVTSAASTLVIDAAEIWGNVFNSGTASRIVATGAFDGISLVNFANVDGAIKNEGLISGGQDGIEINGSVVHGGIQNNGTASQILGVANAILITGDSVVAGGITNAGTIAGSAGNGISFQDADIDFQGNITNAATGTIQATAGNAAIDLANFDTFVGNINNSGLIEGVGVNGTGIFLNNGTMTGDITNSTTGDIVASSAGGWGIAIAGGLLDGNIINDGLISAEARGILLSGGTLDGEIQNNSSGTIEATGPTDIAVSINGGTITGGIDNSGKILATNTGGQGIAVLSGLLTGGIENTGTSALIQADAQAILISVATFTGSVTNTGGTIDSNANDAVYITSTTFTGDVTSSGYIEAANTGIQYNNGAGTFTGTITNSSGGHIVAGGDGINVNALVFLGNVTNAGIIDGTSVTDGIELDVATFTGTVTNSGRIGNSGAGEEISGTGLDIDGTTLTGSVVNSGTIYAGRDGIAIKSGLTVSANVTNSGAIFGDANNGGFGDGINIDGTVTGVLSNSSTGLISAEGTAGATAIDVSGSVGSITNAGTILGSDRAIDLTNADTLTTVTQTAGLIRGRNDVTITTALDFSGNGVNDTFNGDGGTLDGNVSADASDDFVMTPTGTFTYLRGSASGLDRFDSLGGTSILGGSARGDTLGEGVGVSAVRSDFDGWVYLDDNTTVTLSGNLDQGATGTMEWFLTTDNTAGNYGTVAAATATLAGEAAVFVDAADFAANPVLTSVTYQDVINSVGALGGAFTNSGTVLTSSLFFTATALEDGGNNIDITLTRLDFSDALAAAGATETTNQNSVADALEAIYTAGGYSDFGSEGAANFEDLYATLFGAGLTPAEIQAMLDDLGGAEHAQNQQMALNVTGQFNEFLGMRLDQTLGSSTGGAMASLGGRQYADAETTATDGSSAAGGGSHGLNRGPSGASVWLRGFGQWVNVDGDPNAAGYEQDTNGAAGGIDYAVANNATVGVAGSWSNSESDFDTAGDSSEMDSWSVGGYGSVGFGRMYVDGLVSYASHDVSTLRTVFDPVPGAPFVAASTYDATAWSAQGEFGMMFGLGRANIQPSVGLSYSDLSTDAFVETGNGGVFNLMVDESSADSFASTLALRAS